MKGHYLHNKHLSQVNANILDSGTWKWICSLKAETLPHMERILGNGNTTSLLFDSWLSDTSNTLISYYSNTRMLLHMEDWSVSDCNAPIPRVW